MTAWHGGKGSYQRKRSISDEEWESRWDAIFSRDKHDDDDKESMGKAVKDQPLKEHEND